MTYVNQFAIVACFAFLSFMCVDGYTSESEPPFVTISNEVLKVKVFLPDAEKGYYRGPRFDWSGLVQDVHYAGHHFYGDWKTSHDPTNFEDANATVGEFGQKNPVGFSEVKEGETFLKIGVGILQKMNNKPYSLFRPYPIVKPLDWIVDVGKSRISFEQKLENFNGWAYEYTKVIELDENRPVMTISYRFKNMGTKRFDTDYYSHNFTIIDGKRSGSDYQLTFPFDAKLRRDLDGEIIASSGSLTIRSEVLNQSLYSELEGWEPKPEHYAVTVSDKKTGVGVHIKGDKAPSRIDFFAAPYSVCPEFFVPIQLDPGEELDWKDTYTFFVPEKN